jgi:DEAD/DEAH box helicase domain-containing protein
VTNLIRRLYNVVDSLGGNSKKIQYILASATIGNAPQMALQLTSRQSAPYRLHWISESGASQPERTIVCFGQQDKPLTVTARIIVDW